MTPTAAEIDAARTPKGGWSRETLAQWGVPWPPPAGWRKELIAKTEAGEEPSAVGEPTRCIVPLAAICATCRFFHNKGMAWGGGQCRIGRPHMPESPNAGLSYYPQYGGVWPQTTPTDFCGEHQPRPDQPE